MGARYVGCAGTMAAGQSITDTSRIAELIDRVPHGNARLGLSRSPAIIARAQRSVSLIMPRNGLLQELAQDGLVSGEKIGGGINSEGQIELMHGFNGSTAPGLSAVRFRLSAIRAN